MTNFEKKSNVERNDIHKPSMLVYMFDSGKINDCFYGEKIFELIVKGKELISNNYKTVFSVGDILNNNICDDISPFVIDNEVCTVNKKRERYKDYIYAVLIEDIEIAKKIDARLKLDCNAYIGMTLIDIDSKDERKQFWKELIRLFSIERNTITCFGQEESGFCYFTTAKENGFYVNFDGFVDDFECENSELFSTRQSSFISKMEQLRIVKGRNDSDRGILEMNFSLVKEVEIAGVQIWKAIEDINHVYIPKCGRETVVDYIFTSLYQAAQGIERLLKILIELIVYRDKEIDKVKADNLLLSHNHVAMYEFVIKSKQISIDTNCKKLLSILNEFYSDARYSRYSYNEDDVSELHLLQEFGDKLKKEDFNEKVKHLYGKSLGQIAQNVYKVILSLSGELNIYVYELNAESVANFVLHDYYGKDLYQTLKQIEQAKREFLWYVIKKGQQFRIAKIADDIEPLDFDEGDVLNYLDNIVTNENSCFSLHNFVDTMYDELIREDKAQWKEHMEAVEALVGNKCVFFEEDETEEY